MQQYVVQVCVKQCCQLHHQLQHSNIQAQLPVQNDCTACFAPIWLTKDAA